MSHGTLRISDGLALPLRAVTEKIAFLGRTGSGKTYAAQKLAEAMHAADAQCIVLDGVGVWYGLRLAADGKAPGLPIPVLGGLHGDIPLEPGGGALIANLVVDRGVSVVLDVSQFESDADKARFAQAFADRFFFRKKAAPSAVHLFLEECQEFVPQNPQREEARMLHAFTRLVKIGRNFGIGVSLISQRPQEVNKKVLNLTELLFAFQLTGPQERKTLQGWIAEKGIDEDIAGELPKLAVGHAHVWSPAWLKISQVVAIARKTTYDASSTPTVGGRAATRALAPIDLERLRVDMAATIEKAKAEDPKELRQRIAELQKQIADAQRTVVAPPKPAREKRVEVPILKDAQIRRLEQTGAAVRKAAADVEKALVTFHATMDRAYAFADALQSGIRAKLTPSVLERAHGIGPARPTIPSTSSVITTTMPPRRATRTTTAAVEGITPAKQRILNALAFLEGVGLAQADKTQLALMADAAPTSGAYFNNLGALRTAALITYPRPGTVALTPAGHAVADPGTAPATTEELQAVIRAKLPPAKWRLLEVLIGVYPKPLAKDDLATRAGASETSGAYFNNLGSLRSLGLLDYPAPGQVVACPVLFLEG